MDSSVAQSANAGVKHDYQQYLQVCSEPDEQRRTAVQGEAMVRIREKLWPAQPEGSNVYVRLATSVTLEHDIAESLDEKEQPVTIHGEAVGVIKAKQQYSNRRTFIWRGSDEPNFSPLLLEERAGGNYSRKAVIGTTSFRVPLESVHILWEGAVIGLGDQETISLATVIGFNKEQGTYILRVHNSEDKLERFDPTAATYFQLPDAAPAPYPAGTHLAVLYEDKWQDANVLMHLGHAQGCRYKVQIDGSEVAMDLNRTNHCPSKVENVEQYLVFLCKYLKHVFEKCRSLEDSLTGRKVDTLQHTIDVDMQMEDEDERQKSNCPRHVTETRKLCEDVQNIRDVANLVRNWVEAGSAVRGQGSIKGCPLLMRAAPGAGKTWSTKQLTAILSAVAEKANQHSAVPLLIPVQDMMFRARRAGVEIERGLLEWYLEELYGKEVFFGMLQDAYQSRRVVIILDGMDEAASSRKKLEHYLHQILVPDGFSIVVTSRPEGVDFALYQFSFLRMELKELSSEQQRAIIEHQMKTGNNKKFFNNLLRFLEARTQLNNIYKEHCKNPSSIESISELDTTVSVDGKEHLDDSRQLNVEGNVVSTPSELEAVAKECKPVLDAELKAICRLAGLDEDQLLLVENKNLETALQKGEKKYPPIEGVRSGPSFAWLRDIVRSSILCATGEQLLHILQLLSSHKSLKVVRLKNYFSNLDSTNFRRFNVTVKVPFKVNGQSTHHLVEVQIHSKAIFDYKHYNEELMHKPYEYFRTLFNRDVKKVKTLLDGGWMKVMKEAMDLYGEFLKSPVLLSLFVRVLESLESTSAVLSVDVLPSSKADLYAKAQEDVVKKVLAEGVDADVLQTALEMLSAANQFSQRRQFSSDDVREALKSRQDLLEVLNLQFSKAKQMPFVKILEHEGSDFASRGIFQLLHLSFQEFLCAQYLPDVNLSNDPSWKGLPYFLREKFHRNMLSLAEDLKTLPLFVEAVVTKDNINDVDDEVRETMHA